MALLVKIGADIKSFDRDMNKVLNSVKPLTQKLESIGKTLTASLTLPLTAIAGLSIKTAADFDSAMNQVAAISGATGDELEALRDKAKEMGATTSKSASESAEAMSYMAMAGWRTTDMLDGLEGILRLSEASGADLATTSDIVTDALTAFGLSAKDSGDFADLLASTSSNANTNVEMLGESFKYVAPLFGAMGYTAEDCAMALGLMANAGIKGSQAGTSLKTAIANLASPTKSMKNAMNDLGISLTDSEGKMKTFYAIMQDLREAFGDLDETQQTAYASTIFGKEAMSGMLAIINASEQDFQKLEVATESYHGAATDMAKTMQQGLNGQLTELKSKLEGVAITIGEKLEPIVSTLVGWISNLVDKFTNLSPAMQNVVLVLGGFAAALGPILLIVASLIKLKQMWTVASTTVAIANGALSLSVIALIGWIIAIVAAIASVVGVITYLWNTNENFRNFITTCWESIKTTALAVWETISTFVSEIWTWLVDLGVQLFERLKVFFFENQESINEIIGAVWGAISGYLSWVWNSIKSIAETVFNALKAFWDVWGETIIEVFSQVWNMISGLFEAYLTVISGLFDTFAGLFTGNWEKMWTGVEKVFSGIWDGIKSMFGKAINWMICKLNGFIKGVNKIRLPDWVPGIGGMGINIPLIPEVALAKGGIVTRPTVALTGEAGPEAVIPLKKLHDFLPQQTQDSNNGQPVIELSLKIDNFYNNTDNDIQNIADELAYLIRRKQFSLGGV